MELLLSAGQQGLSAGQLPAGPEKRRTEVRPTSLFFTMVFPPNTHAVIRGQILPSLKLHQDDIDELFQRLRSRDAPSVSNRCRCCSNGRYRSTEDLRLTGFACLGYRGKYFIAV
jgi:hypothetical protein